MRTKTAKVLVVEDEPAIREMISLALSSNGFESIGAESAEQARIQIKNSKPDLILLDWMLPGLSGMDLARELKADPLARHLPIIMLTARAEEGDKVEGLGAGADDYITKPFSPKELVARVKAVLRRAAPTIPIEPVEVAGLRLDPDSHRVTVLQKVVTMGPTEFQLLYYFMTHPERVFSRAQLIQQVWGNNIYVEDRTVDVHIRRLRKALEPSGHDSMIQTVRGAGYRLSTRG
ncbi:MAG: phosphate regulon transcriptional regulator PhoB [Arenicellales bacterium]|nr:phosphate regulon transcriptional regulator PhoB [Arenicellales bacterium]